FTDDPRKPPPGDHWVCVQSVYVDGRDRLWVLDPAAPQLGDVVRGDGGGPKLVEIDLSANTVRRIIRFDKTIAPDRSYLNDGRLRRHGVRRRRRAVLHGAGEGRDRRPPS